MSTQDEALRNSGKVTAVSRAHGEWLLQQRQSRGWSGPQMVRKLREAAESAGDELPDQKINDRHDLSLGNGRSGISQQYRLHYCAAFKTPIDRFGDPSILEALHASQVGRLGTGYIGEAGPLSLQDRMQAVLSQFGDPAQRDQMCFLLGYPGHPARTEALR